MGSVDFDQHLHRTYHQGRALDASTMRQWMDAIRPYVGQRDGLIILDLGCGTGRFSGQLAEEFQATVFGVEPSEKMRAAAMRECRHPAVRFVAGAAGEIPLGPATCDAAWLSQIIHHVPDMNAAASELFRVVKPEGLVFIRNNFKDRLQGYSYYRFFPTGLEVDNARHPTVEAVRQTFEENGFQHVAFETITQTEAQSLKEYTERIRLRAFSTFYLISDEEFEQGLQAMQQAAAQEESPQPVTANVDLLVMKRSA